MAKKTLQEELGELEERKKQVEKELETKRKIVEKKQEDKREAFEKKIWKIFSSCKGNVIDDWYDTSTLGYGILQSFAKEGYFYYGWEKELEKSIKNTEEYLKEEQERIRNHLERLKDFLVKLRKEKEVSIETII